MASLNYFLRLYTGSAPILYGPMRYKISKSELLSAKASSFEYCHAQNSQSERFAMQNEVKYEKATTAASQTGTGISQSMETMTTEASEMEYEIKDNQVLVSYIQVSVLAFITSAGGQPQYLHVPVSGVITRCISKDNLTDITSSGKILLDAASWDCIAAELKVETSDISAVQAKLEPKLVEPNGEGTFLIHSAQHDRTVAMMAHLDGEGRHNVAAVLDAGVVDKPDCKFTIKLSVQNPKAVLIYNAQHDRTVAMMAHLDGEGRHNVAAVLGAGVVDKPDCQFVKMPSRSCHGAFLLYNPEHDRTLAMMAHLDGEGRHNVAAVLGAGVVDKPDCQFKFVPLA